MSNKPTAYRPFVDGDLVQVLGKHWGLVNIRDVDCQYISVIGLSFSEGRSFYVVSIHCPVACIEWKSVHRYLQCREKFYSIYGLSLEV